MPIFVQLANCRIIIAQTAYLKTPYITKYTFTMALSRPKLVTMILFYIFGRYSHFKFRSLKTKPCFFKFLNCHIITAQTTYFESIQYSKIYFPYGFVLSKTSYNDFNSFVRKIYSSQISNFKKNANSSQIIKFVA